MLSLRHLPIIAEPMIREKILPLEELRIVLQRAAAMNEEIADGEDFCSRHSADVIR